MARAAIHAGGKSATTQPGSPPDGKAVIADQRRDQGRESVSNHDATV